MTKYTSPIVSSIFNDLKDKYKRLSTTFISTIFSKKNEEFQSAELVNDAEINELTIGPSNSSLKTPSRSNAMLKISERCICCKCSKRWQLAWLACLGFLIVFGIRCNIGAAKVRMIQNFTDAWERKHVAEFNWNSDVLGVVEGSFFYGYLVTQVPGGFIAARFPATTLFGMAIGMTSLLNLFMPAACYSGYGYAVFIQILQGLSQGVAYPAVHGIWRFWAPPLERTKLATSTFTGSYAGAVIGLPVSALLTSYVNWTAAFYFYGVCGCVWFVFWYCLSYEKPCVHPTISDKERLHIESEIGVTSTVELKFSNVPWKEIFKSKAVWAILVANFCRSWTFYLLLLHQLTYMKEVLHIDIENSGFLASLPHILMAAVVLMGGQLADKLRSKQILSTTSVRKIFNCGGFGLEGFFLIICAYVRQTGWAMTCLILAVGFSGFAISGFNVNHLDLAPRYASILMGMSNGLGTFAGMICPVVTEKLTAKYHQNGWVTVLLTAGLIHFTGILFYGIFASGEQQPWAEPSQDEITFKRDVKKTDYGSSCGTRENIEFTPLQNYEENSNQTWDNYQPRAENNWTYGGNASVTNQNFYTGY